MSGSVRSEDNGRFLQNGMVLLEALVSLLIFALGLLALIAMQANAVRYSTAAKYRMEAMSLASEIVAQLWADGANIPSYAHLPSGAACTPSGGATASPAALAWLGRVGATLPEAPAEKQQIVVGPDNVVTLRLCWRAPGEAAPHSLTLATQIRP